MCKIHITVLLVFYFYEYVTGNTFQPSEPAEFSVRRPQLKIHIAEEAAYQNGNNPDEITNNPKDEIDNDESRIYKRKVLSQPISFSYNKDHEDVKSKPKKESHKSGGGKTHYSDHKSSAGEKAEKGHKEYHGDEYSKKGHHNKEGHKGSYKDEGGKKKKHFDEHGFEGNHHKIQKGEKKSKYEEEGEHKKGHNTKGEHNINKKNHYEKKHEFFDEYYEDGNSEKHGAHHAEKDFHKGGSKKGSHGGSGHHEDHYGKKGHHEKGKHYAEQQGHKKADGHDEHHKHDEKYGKKSSNKHAKKWGFKHGDGGDGKSKKKQNLDAHKSGTEDKLQKVQYFSKNPTFPSEDDIKFEKPQIIVKEQFPKEIEIITNENRLKINEQDFLNNTDQVLEKIEENIKHEVSDNSNFRENEAEKLPLIVNNGPIRFIQNDEQARNTREANAKNKLNKHVPLDIMYINKMLMDTITIKEKNLKPSSSSHHDSVIDWTENNNYKLCKIV